MLPGTEMPLGVCRASDRCRRGCVNAHRQPADGALGRKVPNCDAVSRAVPVAYLACALIWGTTWYAIRVSIAPGAYPTLAALALRFAIAAVILLPFAARARPWPRG